MAEFEGYRSRQIQTVIGTARIERAYYHCPSCRSGFAPLDQELGLSRRSLSRALERAICRLAAVESFEHTVEDLYDVGGVSVSAKEAQLVSESIGAAIALQEAARRGVDDAKVVIGLGDGAPWIWNLMGEHFPGAVQILDFYHASGHLWELGNALYGEGTERTKRFARYKQDQLKAGEVSKVIAAL